MATILNIPYSTIALINKDESGFRASRIVPYNDNVFSEQDFIADEILAQSNVIIQDSSIVILSTSSPTIQHHIYHLHPVLPNSLVLTNLIPSTLVTAIHHMLSKLSTTIDPILSTSSVNFSANV